MDSKIKFQKLLFNKWIIIIQGTKYIFNIIFKKRIHIIIINAQTKQNQKFTKYHRLKITLIFFYYLFEVMDIWSDYLDFKE